MTSSRRTTTIKFQSKLVEVIQRHPKIYCQTFADFKQFLRLFLRHCQYNIINTIIADNSVYRQDPELSVFTSYQILNFSSYCIIKLAFTAKPSSFQNSIQYHWRPTQIQFSEERKYVGYLAFVKCFPQKIHSGHSWPLRHHCNNYLEIRDSGHV